MNTITNTNREKSPIGDNQTVAISNLINGKNNAFDGSKVYYSHHFGITAGQVVKVCKYDKYEVAKKRKQPYKKPDSIKQLERELLEQKRQKHPNIPHIESLKDNLRDDNANALTKCIAKYLKLHGHFAARVNTTGNYNAKLGKWVGSGSRKGMADISAVMYGRHVSIEIKIGSDKPRPEQLQGKQEIEKSGGIYLFVKSFDDFLKQIEAFNKIVE